MDGSSKEGRSGAGLILVSLGSSNNETEYEALIARLNLVKEIKVESFKIYSDSQLIVCQVTSEYQA